MARWAPIRYRDFWDVPRTFLVDDGRDTILFDCPFDTGGEEYASAYCVWLMPALTEQELVGSWARLADRGIRLLGHVPVEDVSFDASKRRKVDLDVLGALGDARG
jgi:hypothetical protein